MLQSNMCEQFQIDYNSLGSETEFTFHAAKLTVNVNKNRYKNILPCKQSTNIKTILFKNVYL